MIVVLFPFLYQIEVTETDAVPALSTSASVTIIVLNINDHGPMFPATPTQYEYSVTENTAGAALTTQGGVTDIVVSSSVPCSARSAVYMLLSAVPCWNTGNR